MQMASGSAIQNIYSRCNQLGKLNAGNLLFATAAPVVATAQSARFEYENTTTKQGLENITCPIASTNHEKGNANQLFAGRRVPNRHR